MNRRCYRSGLPCFIKGFHKPRSRSSRLSMAGALAAALNWRSPAISALPQRRPASACPNRHWALSAAAAAFPRLTRLVGAGAARHMCLTGEMDAKTALDYGIVTRVFSVEDLEPEAAKIAERIATLAPISIAQTKRILAASGRWRYRHGRGI